MTHARKPYLLHSSPCSNLGPSSGQTRPDAMGKAASCPRRCAPKLFSTLGVCERSDFTAALFFSVCACVCYVYYASLPPLRSLPDPPCSPPPDSTALSTLCIPSILANMHRRMILSCLPFSMPSVVRLHLQLCSTIRPLYPYDEIQLLHVVSRVAPA